MHIIGTEDIPIEDDIVAESKPRIIVESSLFSLHRMNCTYGQS